MAHTMIATPPTPDPLAPLRALLCHIDHKSPSRAPQAWEVGRICAMCGYGLTQILQVEASMGLIPYGSPLMLWVASGHASARGFHSLPPGTFPEAVYATAAMPGLPTQWATLYEAPTGRIHLRITDPLNCHIVTLTTYDDIDEAAQSWLADLARYAGPWVRVHKLDLPA